MSQNSPPRAEIGCKRCGILIHLETVSCIFRKAVVFALGRALLLFLPFVTGCWTNSPPWYLQYLEKAACELPDFASFLGWKSLCDTSQGTLHPSGKLFCSLHHQKWVKLPPLTLKICLQSAGRVHQDGARDLSTHTLAMETTCGGFLDKIMGFEDVSWGPCKRKAPPQAESSEAPSSSNEYGRKFGLLWQGSHQKRSKVSQTIDMHHPFWKKLLFCLVSRTRAGHHTWNKMVADKNADATACCTKEQ